MENDEVKNIEEPETLTGQPCPFCNKNTLTLMQMEQDIPYFGKTFVFSMNCESCEYHKADVEKETAGEGSRYTFEVTTEEDLKVRIVKSSSATVKIPHITTITPGPAANGYVTNVEGIINRVMNIIEQQKESEEDEDQKKKCKNMLKKLNKMLWGQEALKIIIEDPTGNSAIISDKAVKNTMK